MEIDKTTLADLSIFQTREEYSVLDKLNLTRTTGGRDRLQHMFQHPLKSIEAINEIQETLKLILKNDQQWPLQISNGSIMMIYKFYEEALLQPAACTNVAEANIYKILHLADYYLNKYSVGHAFSFLRGMHQIVDTFLSENTPVVLKSILERAGRLLKSPSLD